MTMNNKYRRQPHLLSPLSRFYDHNSASVPLAFRPDDSDQCFIGWLRDFENWYKLYVCLRPHTPERYAREILAVFQGFRRGRGALSLIYPPVAHAGVHFVQREMCPPRVYLALLRPGRRIALQGRRTPDATFSIGAPSVSDSCLTERRGTSLSLKGQIENESGHRLVDFDTGFGTPRTGKGMPCSSYPGSESATLLWSGESGGSFTHPITATPFPADSNNGMTRNMTSHSQSALSPPPPANLAKTDASRNRVANQPFLPFPRRGAHTTRLGMARSQRLPQWWRNGKHVCSPQHV
ncbi:hypothetical protein F5148DRAFT_1240057 [Russula earlei]|uniref:Uncharacterized protein n=1 Tax=Russula earlei TaxID=71964 RepID=A0ACC0TW33_9AGAM|nr:hypothetical protein F5148DRAFT_1240057 [Russula earlei]